jgi:hypothetical protein
MIYDGARLKQLQNQVEALTQSVLQADPEVFTN